MSTVVDKSQAGLTARQYHIGIAPGEVSSVALLPGEAARVRRGHSVPVRPSTEASNAPWVRLTSGSDLVALGHLEPLGRGALALAKPKIVLSE